MSILESEPLAAQRFYRSAPLPCPYLPGRFERKLFTKLEPETARDVNSTLIREGFRRSHDIVYRPVCPTCSACTPVRVPVKEFIPDRTQRRTVKRNRDLSLEILKPLSSAEQYALFVRYQASRHADGSMARMSESDYAALIKEQGENTSALFMWRDENGTLKGAMLVDCLQDGYSAVYSFFDPDEETRSLGTFMILSLIEEARRTDRSYIYLGYYIEGLPKMAYKARFRPLEAITKLAWEKAGF
jgi:arginine-tRNA-protein transferase